MYFLQNATNQISQALNPLQDIAKALHDADQANVVLAGATIALAISTIGFGLWDRKRQNAERFERVRPWITITEPRPLQVIFQSGQAMEWQRQLLDKTNILTF